MKIPWLNYIFLIHRPAASLSSRDPSPSMLGPGTIPVQTRTFYLPIYSSIVPTTSSVSHVANLNYGNCEHRWPHIIFIPLHLQSNDKKSSRQVFLKCSSNTGRDKRDYILEFLPAIHRVCSLSEPRTRRVLSAGVGHRLHAFCHTVTCLYRINSNLFKLLL